MVKDFLLNERMSVYFILIKIYSCCRNILEHALACNFMRYIVLATISHFVSRSGFSLYIRILLAEVEIGT